MEGIFNGFAKDKQEEEKFNKEKERLEQSGDAAGLIALEEQRESDQQNKQMYVEEVKKELESKQKNGQNDDIKLVSNQDTMEVFEDFMKDEAWKETMKETIQSTIAVKSDKKVFE